VILDPKGFFKRVCDALHISPGRGAKAKVAEIVDITKSSAGFWEDGKMPGLTGLENVVKVSELSGASLHWLLTGKGPIHISDAHLPEGESPVYFGEKEREIIQTLASESGRSFDEEVRELIIESLISRGLVTDQVEGANLIFFGQHVPKLVSMKLLGEIAAGAAIDVFLLDETVLVPEEYVVQGRKNFVLRVKGNSMIDEGILDKDLIICYESATAENGDTVVALIDGDKATVKKFYKERDRIRLQPRNEDHEPILVPPDRIMIRGIVVGIFRRI
jgi:repressor LexA